MSTEEQANLTYNAEQIDQLLQCSVCLDRYNNPRILPCQHTFCLSPCLVNLVERRYIKCPQCREIHFLPPEGAGGFPVNRTVLGFLDLQSSAVEAHIEHDGDPTKCKICSKEEELSLCLHCSKKICNTCKSSHLKQMKNDMGRLVSQTKKSLKKISDFIGSCEQKTNQVNEMYEGLKREISSDIEKLVKEIKDKEMLLLSEATTMHQMELRNLMLAKENLEVDFASVSSHCDSVDSILKNKNADVPEVELVDLKTQCLDNMKQVQSAEESVIPQVKRPRFSCDSSTIRRHLVDFGKIVFTTDSSMNRPVTPESSRSTDSVVRDVRVPNRRMSPEWLSYGGQAGYTAFDIPHGDYRQEYMRTEPVTGPRRGRSQRNAPRNVVQAVEDTANRLHAMLQTRRNYDNRVEEILNQTHPEPRRTYGRSDHPRRRRRGWNDANRSQQQDNNNTNLTQRRSPNNNSPPVRAPTDNSPAAARGSPGSSGSRASGSRTSGTPPVTGRTSAREAAGRAALNRQARSEVQRDQESNPPAARDSDRGNSESPGVRRAPTTRGQTDTASGEHTSQPAEQMDTQDVNGSAAIDSRDTNAQGSTSDSSPIVPPTAAPRESTFVLEATTNRDLPRDTQRRPVAFQVDLNTDDPSQSMRFEQNDYHRRGNRVRAVVGSRGSTDGLFTWPRGVACNPAHNTFVVADSSNHRCQVFDLQGNFRFSFGSYGQADGEFDCLAGVAVDPHGRIVIADRYNHRIQVFGYDGQFELSFGSEGRNPGELSYPWGVCCDNNARIYVCDKENHRIQVFEPDGRLINTFGSLGSGPGQLENPHYLAVTESRVIVSDSSNHRLQVFHIHGEFISSIGGEGSENGNFKHPRGVAVDSNGYVLVGDSGNNRVQVFRPDMTYYCDWGDWGSSPGQFKGIEGIAVGSRTRVCVSDRENHRVQVF